jgi:hypothetical protein
VSEQLDKAIASIARLIVELEETKDELAAARVELRKDEATCGACTHCLDLKIPGHRGHCMHPSSPWKEGRVEVREKPPSWCALRVVP